MSIESPIEAPPDRVGYDAVIEMRATRRKRRIGDTEWGELAYRVYTTALVCLTIGLVLSGMIGDDHLSPAAVNDVRTVGPMWAGLLLAAVVLMAVRSGRRGGPLAMQENDVHHLLLGPVRRDEILRRPTVGVLGYGVAAGVVLFALVGSLMAQRLPGAAAEWMGSGALFGAVLTATALGSGLLTSSRALRKLVPTVLAWVLVLWAVADIADRAPTAPTTYAGRIAFWPLAVDARSMPALVLGAALAVAGALLIGGLCIEDALRRTKLVGQLRFAVTQQDMRSVLLLRRQLAAERPRTRPWFRVPRFVGRLLPVMARDLQSVAHWPPIRVLRVIVLGAATGLTLRAMWSGTTPLILVAGIAAFVAGLDATEPLAQEVDHPTFTESLPHPEGEINLHHLAQPLIVMLGVGLVGLFTAWAVDPDPLVLELGGVVVVTAALAAVAAAAVSVVSGRPPDNGEDVMMPPEVAGPRVVFRTAWPPLIAVIGFLPVLAASRVTGDVDPVSVAITTAMPVLVLVGAVALWVRYRENMHEAMAESMGTTK